MVHVKYPSMERQDLTQAQLGSFKFIPVDEAPRDPPQPHPLCLSQYGPTFRSGGWNGQQHYTSDMVSDPSFFNHQIKPSLDSSRLRLGPAAVRAAVESASSSPQKHFSHRRPQDPMRGNAQSFFPHFLGSSEHDSMPSMYASEVRSSDMSEGNLGYVSDASSSLLRALQNEQDSHQATKDVLAQEINIRREAEAETERLLDHNRGLLNSIKLLQSTVKHMVQKENEPDADVNQVLDKAVQEYKEEAEKTGTNNSILYDALSKYKVPCTTTNKKGEETTSTFDLNLLDILDDNDRSEKAQLQRTLRRQIGLSFNSENKNDLNGIYQEKIEAIFKGSSKSISGVEEQKITVLPFRSAVSEPESEIETTAEMKDELRTQPVQAPPAANQTPMLELPASFLSKYGKKPTEPPLPLVEVPKKGNLTAIPVSKNDGEDANIEGKKAIRRVARVYMPDSPVIEWKIDARHADELRGKKSEYRIVDSHFAQHPIRYVPTMGESNLFRTVMIDFIPIGTTYGDLLASTRGGTLDSIQLYGPIGDATDFVTARIIYTEETGATALYRRGQDPGIKLHGRPVRVWQVLEPTYPKNAELEEAIYNEGYTRILLVNAPHLDNVDDLLRQKLRAQAEAGFILDIGTSFEGLPMVEFTSIEEATKALKLLMCDAEFGGTCFDFEDDYCAARYT